VSPPVHENQLSKSNKLDAEAIWLYKPFFKVQSLPDAKVNTLCQQTTEQTTEQITLSKAEKLQKDRKKVHPRNYCVVHLQDKVTPSTKALWPGASFQNRSY
jgi:hypothetical protein